ncbi:MAG: serine/threonine-protein kinase [Verrucomicrobiales bacterium]
MSRALAILENPTFNRRYAARHKPGRAQSSRPITHPYRRAPVSGEHFPTGHFGNQPAPARRPSDIDGASLAEILPDDGFPLDQALEYLLPVLAAVEAAHAAGIVHRDLKPSNILVSCDGEVKVADFGLAESLENRLIRLPLTMTGAVAGTTEYLAPELFRQGGAADARSDLYALGVLLYELLAGVPPRGAWRPASEIQPVDIRYDDAIGKAMHPDPAQRFASAGEMRAAILRVGASPPRYAGAPRLNRAVRAADFLWSLGGAFCLLLSTATFSHLDKEPVKLPLNLFGDRLRLVAGWLAAKALLLALGAMGLWQIARLWRFRRVPLREALPAPFGLALGAGHRALGDRVVRERGKS